MSPTQIQAVTFYTRPGCPFSASLRWQLRRLRIPLDENDIWADRSAAARVRQITGGDETVPTVVVGPAAMVNPSVARVRAALAAHAPHLDTAPPPRTAALVLRGLLGPLLTLAGWSALALHSPHTVYHLGPALVAASWAVAARLDAAIPLRRGLAVALAAGGALIATAALLVLPVVGSVPTGPVEALVAVLGGALVGAGVAARGGRPRHQHAEGSDGNSRAPGEGR